MASGRRIGRKADRDRWRPTGIRMPGSSDGEHGSRGTSDRALGDSYGVENDVSEATTSAAGSRERGDPLLRASRAFGLHAGSPRAEPGCPVSSAARRLVKCGADPDPARPGALRDRAPSTASTAPSGQRDEPDRPREPRGRLRNRLTGPDADRDEVDLEQDFADRAQEGRGGRAPVIGIRDGENEIAAGDLGRCTRLEQDVAAKIWMARNRARGIDARHGLVEPEE